MDSDNDNKEWLANKDKMDSDGNVFDPEWHESADELDENGRFIRNKRKAETPYINEMRKRRSEKKEKIESKLFAPVSLNDLSLIFDMNPIKIKQKLKPLNHEYGVGERKYYDLAKACRYLVNPTDEVVARLIEDMAGKDMPARLRKEFWDGRNAQLKYKKEAGELWRTDDVAECLTTIFKDLRSGIIIFSDTINRREELTDEQREIINELCDNLIDSLRSTLEENESLAGYSNFLISETEEFDSGSDSLDVGGE